MLTGLVGICVGTYALLDQTAPQWLVWPGLAGGVTLAALGFWSAGRRVQRSRYRPDHWHLAEVVVALSGIAVGVAFVGVLRDQIEVLHPPLDAVPTVSAGCLVAVLLGAVAAVVSPPPALAEATVVPLEVDDARAA